jgi:phosphopantothenoylcysteine synthetase/decarboxylase
MNLLVTAGNTLTMIDRVRCITNVFTGRTGAGIALAAFARGHAVTLLTSHPEAVEQLAGGSKPHDDRWRVQEYRTFEDLCDRMGGWITAGGLDAVVHCAAVSDYLSAGVYAPAEGTEFVRDPRGPGGRWQADGTPALIDRAAGKVKSDERELWVRLVRAPKLIDLVRPEWGFRGILVKFKLEVGLSDTELLDVAERSRRHSDADVMVANTLEGAAEYAFIGAAPGDYERVERRVLAERLLDVLETLHRQRPS